MPSIGTLWAVTAMPQTTVIRSAAALGGLDITLAEGYKHFEDNKKPEFLAKFPHGKIPAFEGENGFTLTEGLVIARYVAGLAPNSGLLGNSAEDTALVDQWVHFAETEIFSMFVMIFQLLNGHLAYNKAIHTTFIERQLRSLATLETHLSTRTFLVGERITLADLTAAAILHRVVANTADAPTRAKLPNTIRFLETIVNQPKLKDIYGPINYIEKALQYVPPKKEKEAKPAAAPAPAAPKEKKPKEEDDEDDGNLVPEEPKAKNPLDSLPKSTFNLEDWKRAYSNKDTRGAGGALEWFYENFDSEGFSVWRVDFKYNEELTLTFMSSNQIGGFFNRLEASRKYLFGSVGVLGEPNASIISGALILRGQEVGAVVDCAPDWESYEYKKLDLSNADDKAYFEAALAWDLEVDGKAWKDGKNFK
ncbi:eEF1-gamma domain-containing protein [Leucogyrophana mollusca]|uniref:EEF1-gamma domain-containing protein n=1 Tax=Leucogyrophana mollusca TaxID=85980 RepID=A0ACB8BPM3_9AGAM|nr:eEF1-gamma domain-containing protein [Leucogyrophana mollusca]